MRLGFSNKSRKPRPHGRSRRSRMCLAAILTHRFTFHRAGTFSATGPACPERQTAPDSHSIIKKRRANVSLHYATIRNHLESSVTPAPTRLDEMLDLYNRNRQRQTREAGTCAPPRKTRVEEDADA